MSANTRHSDVATNAIPQRLVAKLAGARFDPVTLGESGDALWRCTTPDQRVRYLKLATASSTSPLRREAERLEWMRNHGIRVPALDDYGEADGREFLIVDELQGTPASDPAWASTTPELGAAIGMALAQLHRMSIEGCPFDQRIAGQLREVRQRIENGLVREDDFDDDRLGRSAEDLFSELVRSVPDREDLVFTHGDYCLPNIIVRAHRNGDVEVVGFVDVGRAGIADRYQDVALAVRSLQSNFGNAATAPFLESYGLPQPDSKKLRFYTLLDEFF